MYGIKPYDTTHFNLWNDFVARSKNGTFLFHRDFMEYHADRFTDYSLMIFDGNKLVALLPANRAKDIVFSHQGLTYGGLVLGNKTKLADVILIFKDLLQYLNHNGTSRLHIKCIPHFYYKLPSNEIDYALFLAQAKLTRRDSLSVIQNSMRLPVTKTRREAINRGKKNNLVIVEEPEFKLFWDTILIPNLQLKHDAKPVHTLDEIILLHKKFPHAIRQFNVYYNNSLVAGTTVFVTDTVAHPQYISGNKDKNTLGSLDFLYAHLISDVFKDKKFFDFGPSNEQHGFKLKEGIAFWKESFGARTVTQDFYEVDTANYSLLNDVLI